MSFDPSKMLPSDARTRAVLEPDMGNLQPVTLFGQSQDIPQTYPRGMATPRPDAHDPLVVIFQPAWRKERGHLAVTIVAEAPPSGAVRAPHRRDARTHAGAL